MPMTDQGFQRQTYAELLEQQINRAKQLFGADMDTSETSVLGKYIRLNTADYAELQESLEAVYQARYIDTASGVQLDRLCPFAGIQRNTATRSEIRVLAQNSSTRSVTIPQATKLLNADGVLFHTLERVTIAGNESAQLSAECDTAGVAGNNPTTLQFYQTQVANVTITQPELVSAGAEIETDMALRARWKASISGAGTSTTAAIIGEVLRVSGVTDCMLFENATNSNLNDGTGFIVPPHSFEVVVSGATNSGGEIANAIYRKKPVGIAAVGTETFTIRDVANQSHTIGFSYGKFVTVSCSITVQKKTGFLIARDVPAIVQAILQQAGNLKMGESLSPTAFYQPVAAIEAVEDVSSIVLQKSTGEAAGYGEKLTIGAKETASIQQTAVSVQVGKEGIYAIGEDGTVKRTGDAV
ncbi:putative uncharacterized protein [Ruminococcus sp. CAG:403]|nr:putative uncharacterized protein [Ruminococcus sp. CAG:403]DAR55238.1 MAG TPA: Baseplate wedge protein [Caudoviricetes sp.]